MKIFITDTNKTEFLGLIDHVTGCDYVQDFIGNHGGLNPKEKDSGFHYNQDTEMWETNQAEFDWWKKVIDDIQALEYRIEELSKIHGKEKVYEVIHNVSADLEDYCWIANSDLDEAFN